MKKGLPPSNQTYPDNVERSIQSRMIRRIFGHLTRSTTILQNGLNEMMVIADRVIDAIDKRNGGIPSFHQSILNTRRSIAVLTEALDRDLNQPTNNHYERHNFYRDPEEVVRKVICGLSGVRNAISDLLEIDNVTVLKNHYKTHESARAVIEQLTDIDLLLKEFESENPQVFVEILKDPKWKIKERAVEPKKERGRLSYEQEKAKMNALKKQEAEKKQTAKRDEEKRRQEKEKKRQERVKEVAEAIKKAEDERKVHKEAERQKKIAASAQQFADVIEEKNSFIQDPKRLEIANEIYCYMADDDKLTFDILAEDFPETRGELDEQLEILKKELAIVGIKLMGTLKSGGKHTIKYAWVKNETV